MKNYMYWAIRKITWKYGNRSCLDKREGKNVDDSLIINQIISSGMIKGRKYEIHYEDDVDIKKNMK